MDQVLSPNTLAVHAGEPNPKIDGSVTMPIYQTSTYLCEEDVGYHDVKYLRLNNSPNHHALHQKLAILERGEDALVTSSGMAAITAALLSVLKTGDHILVQDGIYGGTQTFIAEDCPDLGIEFDFVDLNDTASWKRALKPNTVAFYAESMTNPLLKVGDLHSVVRFCKDHQLVSLIDNTLATPINFQPITHGFDIVLHSATKYLNGHSDIVAGVIVSCAQRVKKAKLKLDHLGGSLDPHACFLLQRGIKTLPLRIEQQNKNAQALAEFLIDHPAVSAVNYAGLNNQGNPPESLSLFNGFGGLLSFECKAGFSKAKNMVDRLRLAVHAVSLGGVETLVTLPAATTHESMSEEDRQRTGISSGLIRVAVGIEGVEDLIVDFKQALDEES